MKGIQTLFLTLPLIGGIKSVQQIGLKTLLLKLEAQTIQLRHQIHQYPELGNMEFKTSACAKRA